MPRLIERTALRLRKIIGRAVNRKRKTKTKTPRISDDPIVDMKFIVDRLYIKPSPIAKPPMGIPNIGFLYVRKAIRKANIAGNGCGKSGIIDRPKSMLTSVIGKIRNLKNSGSGVLSFSFFFGFSFRFLDETPNPRNFPNRNLRRFGSGFSF
jgi:hypothetical protein